MLRLEVQLSPLLAALEACAAGPMGFAALYLEHNFSRAAFRCKCNNGITALTNTLRSNSAFPSSIVLNLRRNSSVDDSAKVVLLRGGVL